MRLTYTSVDFQNHIRQSPHPTGTLYKHITISFLYGWWLMNNRLKNNYKLQIYIVFLILWYERCWKISGGKLYISKICGVFWSNFTWHPDFNSVVRVSRKSRTIFLLNLCKIQRHMFIYLSFTSKRSQRSVQYNLNQNFAQSADLKGKIKSCAEYRILTHFKYCFYKRLLFDIWIFMDQNNDNIICNRIKLSFFKIYWLLHSQTELKCKALLS